MSPSLPDPRQYASSSLGNNRLIQYANSLLEAQSEEEHILWMTQLEKAIVDLLERDDTLALSVALSLAPSQQHYKIVWQALRNTVEIAPGRHALIFTLPVILVAGSRQQAALPRCIHNVSKLNALLREYGIFSSHAEVSLSGKLLHPDTLLSITPAQLYRYTRHLVSAAGGLPLALEPSAVICHGEGVFLRYLLGIAMQQSGAESAVNLNTSATNWGGQLMTFLAEQLKTNGVTLFPIPRAPMLVMPGIVAGQFTRLDIALQVFSSTTLRRLRAAGHAPVAVIAAHQGGELRFTFTHSAQAAPSTEGFIWPLSPLDSVPMIEATFRQLMAECQVHEIRVVSEIQAALRRDPPAALTSLAIPLSGQTIQ